MKKTALAAALGLSAMLVYGCSNDSEVATTTDDQPVATQKDILSIDDIKAKALNEIEGGEVTSVEQDDKKGIRVYEVEVTTAEVKYELTYDATTGDLLKKEEEEIVRSKVETITINLRSDYAHQLALFLGIQSRKDTEYIIDKYNLKMDKKEMDDIVQHLFDQLARELELEF